MFVFPLLEATCRGVIPFYTMERPNESMLGMTGHDGEDCIKGHKGGCDLCGNLIQGFYSFNVFDF